MPASSQEMHAKAAIRDVQLGMSVRGAALKWNVQRTYLQRRFQGIPTRKETNRSLQALSPYLENQLATWCIGQAKLGYAPSLTKLRMIAQRALAASSGPRTLGPTWHHQFLARNASVRSTRCHIVNYQRVNGATAQNIHVFFDRLDTEGVANIPPSRTYNMDEMGIGQGVDGNHWVIAPNNRQRALKKGQEKGEWITALECISASGDSLPPLLIFKGANVQSQWFPDNSAGMWDNWRFRASPNGWTCNQTGVDWLKDIFIPYIRGLHGNIWVALVCDGHDSHTNDEFLALCVANKVWLVFYEPHCSHVLQPLDVGVFSAVKKRLKKLLRETLNATLGIMGTKEDVLLCYRQARLETLGVQRIRNAWKTAGIYPRDRSKPLSSKYVMLETERVPKVGSKGLLPVRRPSTPDFLGEVVLTPVITPAGGQELRRIGRKLDIEVPLAFRASHRLLVRKASKALDQQAQEIANLRAQVDFYKEKALKNVKPTRQAVKPTPGERFVAMTDIREAKRKLRGRVVYVDEASDCDVVSDSENTDNGLIEPADETQDCIIVETAD
ncbi:putative transposase [Rosellinia necatrix]|uniref:Putative transposase n=1 Tax=Rosellinia necatrix TaxID=77044 RepID=A0A1W2TNE1_ROSNE|nr:putative transposase [Rosellinia necatrix]